MCQKYLLQRSKTKEVKKLLHIPLRKIFLNPVSCQIWHAINSWNLLSVGWAWIHTWKTYSQRHIFLLIYPSLFAFLNTTCRKNFLSVALWKESFYHSVHYSHGEYTTIINAALKMMPWLQRKKIRKYPKTYTILAKNNLS